MALNSLVNYLAEKHAPVKAKVLSFVGTHVLIKITSRSSLRYRSGLLMLVPKTALDLR